MDKSVGSAQPKTGISKVACIQTNTTSTVAHNLEQAEQLLQRAVEQGALLVLLPEMFLSLDAKQYAVIAADDSYLQLLAGWAKQYNVWLVAGAVPQPSADGRLYSASLVFDSAGGLVAQYNKIHLFDAEVSDSQGRYQESKHFAPGKEVVIIDSPVGRLGLSICFDVRFPQLYQSLRAQGAEIIAVPAAFTYLTGQAHWQVLLRARAIETQCYILAANQCGWHDDKRQTWGHSQIINPWGKVLAELEDQPGIISSHIDLDMLKDIRQKMPLHAVQV